MEKLCEGCLVQKEKCELLRKSFVNIRENLNMAEFSLLFCGMPVSTSAGSNSPMQWSM